VAIALWHLAKIALVRDATRLDARSAAANWTVRSAADDPPAYVRCS